MVKLKLSKKILILAILFFVVLVGVFGFFMFGNKKTEFRSIESSAPENINFSEKKLTFDKIQKEVTDGKSILVDVRTEEEFAESSFEGAINIPLEKIKNEELSKILPKDFNAKKIYVFCRSGNRSGQALEVLKSKGVLNARNIGGLSDVEKLGGKLKKLEKKEVKTESRTQTQASTSSSVNSTQMKTVRGILVVNKKYSLPAHYAPGENPEAKQAFLRLLNDMRAQNFPVSASYSGFRSYAHQSQLYSSYVARSGQAQADTFSARPGHSEHQTGLAFDILNSRGQLLAGNPNDFDAPAADWLAKNAHNYGFIVRYLKGKENITGYMAEPWHIRYVGGLAGEIYNSGLTLEEFLDVEGGGYR